MLTNKSSFSLNGKIMVSFILEGLEVDYISLVIKEAMATHRLLYRLHMRNITIEEVLDVKDDPYWTLLFIDQPDIEKYKIILEEAKKEYPLLILQTMAEDNMIEKMIKMRLEHEYAVMQSSNTQVDIQGQ